MQNSINRTYFVPDIGTKVRLGKSIKAKLWKCIGIDAPNPKLKYKENLYILVRGKIKKRVTASEIVETIKGL